MLNTFRFKELIPFVLRSVPYIHQSHTGKAYCALESLYAQRPQLPDAVWEYCSSLIREDEPKVEGLLAPELLALKEIVDPTSGRDFGPDWILGRGLMPLSYWAMQQKVQEQGFEAVFKEYLKRALEHPRSLGHELSILSGNWRFYQTAIASSERPEERALFLQRFTEFVTVTFARGEQDLIQTIDPSQTIKTTPSLMHQLSEAEVLVDALTNPGFFGHHVLAFVWGMRLKPMLSEAEHRQLLMNLSLINGEDGRDDPTRQLRAIDERWDDEELDRRLAAFFLHGPTNIHQITLAEALLWCWSHYPDYRGLIAANFACFSEGVSPRALQ